jgi:hypothetical protein
MIDKMTHKSENMLKLLLIMKVSLPDINYLYMVIILIKFLGMFIISNFFMLSENIYSKNFIQLLRTITCFGIFSNISYNLYSSLSYIFLFLILTYLGLYLWAYKLIRSEDRLNSMDKVSRVVKIINCFNIAYLLLSQHFIEYFSFTYYISFSSKENTIHTLFNQQADYSLLVFNSLGIIFMNVFMTFSFHLLNEPTNITKSSFKLHVNFYCIVTALIYANLQVFHFTDEILDDTSAYNMKIAQFTMILLFFTAQFLKRLHIFYFRSIIFYAIQAVYSYCFFSCIIEIIIYLTSCPITNSQHVMALVVAKAIYSGMYILLSFYVYNGSFNKECNSVLFKEYYNDKFTYYELQSFYYFQNLMITCIQNKNLEGVFKIGFNHKADCSFNNCICRKVKSDFSNISIILENIYNRLNFVKNPKINLLYFEYLLLLRKSDIFAYGMVKTYLHKNRNKMDIFEKVFFHLLLFQSIDLFNNNYVKTLSDFHVYKAIWNKVSLHKSIDGSINDIIKVFEYFIDFKDKFDNYLKIENGVINSFIFNEFNNLVYNCVNLKKYYKNMKISIKENFKNSKCMDFELSYKLSLFFKLFNKKIPESISKLLLNENEELYTLVEDKFTNGRHYNIIFSVNQMFEVKYFSYKLAELMGHQHSTLIGNDLHNIFPRELRENHKKVILKHILIDNNYKFHRRTIAFTSNNSNFLIALRACAFTSFNNELEFICDVEVLYEDPKVYYFVLDVHFNMLSMNKTFEQAYYIDFDLLKRLDLDILKLMDVPQNSVKAKFKESLTAIYTQKEIKNFFFIFNNLFSLNLYLSDQERNIMLKDHYYILNNQTLKESDTSNNIKRDDTSSIISELHRINFDKSSRSLVSQRKSIRMMNSQKDKIFNIQKDKQIIIQILEKVKSKQRDLDLKEEDIKKLESSIRTLRLEDKHNITFKINIYLKNFIDTVFYIVKINEEVVDQPTAVSTYLYDSFNPKNFHLGFKNSGISKITKRSKLADSKFFLSKENINLDPKTITDLKKDDIQRQAKNNKSYLRTLFINQISAPMFSGFKHDKSKKAESTILLILVASLIVIVALHSYLFYFKTTFLDTITTNFECQFWMNYQNLSLNFLHSAIITWMFELAGLSIKSKHYDRQERIKYWTGLYRNSFFKFYDYLDTFDNSTVLQSMHRKNNLFNKISMDWENIAYNTSMFSELNYLQYAAYTLTQIENTTLLSESINDMFLFQQYTSNINKVITKEDKMIYFINNNAPTIFMFMKGAETAILEITDNVFNNTIVIIYIIDGIIIALFLFLTIFARSILNKFDTKFFKLILAMFIDIKKPKESSYKTPLEIGIIRTNIKNFKFLMENIDYEIKEDITVKNLLDIAKQHKIESITSQRIEETPKPKTPNTLTTENRLLPTTTNNNNTTTQNNNNTIVNDKTTSNLPFVNDISRSLVKSRVGLSHLNTRYDKNGNMMEEDFMLITNNMILNETKHHELQLIKVSKYFLFIALAIFLILMLTNIMISSQNFNFFNTLRKLSESFIGLYTAIAQLFNYTRLSVFNFKKLPDNPSYTYVSILTDLGTSTASFTLFRNNYLSYLPGVTNFINNGYTLDGNTTRLFCPDEDTCELNSKGVSAGYQSSMRFIQLIYSDFQKLTIKNPTFDDVKGFFYKTQYNAVLSEVEVVLGNIATTMYGVVLDDFDKLVSSFHGTMTVLGLICLVFAALVIIYIIFIFLTRMKIYLNSIIYSANKFNNALYKE